MAAATGADTMTMEMESFPGADTLPPRLHKYIKCPLSIPSEQLPPWIVLILYAGKDNNSTSAAAIQEVAPWLSKYVVEIDNMRSPNQDMLADEPYRRLHAANEGRIRAVIGGPNCRTWSIRLHIPKKGGGKPLRGSSENIPGDSQTSPHRSWTMWTKIAPYCCDNCRSTM